MKRPLKVFGTLMMTREGHRWIIVATTSKMDAYLAMSWHSNFGCYATWAQYAGEFGNVEGVAIAKSQPGTVFIDRSPNHHRKWEVLK